MSDVQIIKKEAKKSLKKYLKGILVLVILTFLICISSFIIANVVLNIYGASYLFRYITITVFMLIICSIIGFGYNNYFLLISRNINVSWKELFSKTYMFIPYILLVIIVTVLTLFGMVFLIVPGIIIHLMYSQSLLILLDNPEMNIIDAMQYSRIIMAGHKKEYFVLILNFCFWILLGFITFGIGLVYFVPYITITRCKFYNQIKK